MYICKKITAIVVMAGLLTGCSTAPRELQDASLTQCIIGGAGAGAAIAEVGNAYYGVRGSEHRQTHRAEGAALGALAGAVACWNNDTAKRASIRQQHAAAPRVPAQCQRYTTSRQQAACARGVSHAQDRAAREAAAASAAEAVRICVANGGTHVQCRGY